MKSHLRALRRHHRARLIRRVEKWGDWFRAHARKVYNNRKFCTCCVYGCGNPRHLMRGSRRKQLTVQELRQAERMRSDEQEIAMISGQDEGFSDMGGEEGEEYVFALAANETDEAPASRSVEGEG